MDNVVLVAGGSPEQFGGLKKRIEEGGHSALHWIDHREPALPEGVKTVLVFRGAVPRKLEGHIFHLTRGSRVPMLFGAWTDFVLQAPKLRHNKAEEVITRTLTNTPEVPMIKSPINLPALLPTHKKTTVTPVREPEKKVFYEMWVREILTADPGLSTKEVDVELGKRCTEKWGSAPAHFNDRIHAVMRKELLNKPTRASPKKGTAKGPAFVKAGPMPYVQLPTPEVQMVAEPNEGIPSAPRPAVRVKPDLAPGWYDEGLEADIKRIKARMADAYLEWLTITPNGILWGQKVVTIITGEFKV